jgi:predicted nucleic acid-binding protein
MRFALDTNVLVYAEGFDDASKQTLARKLIAGLPPGGAFVSVQVLGELYNVLTRRGLSRAQARTAVTSWRKILFVQGTSETMAFSALDLAGQHRLQIWDALVLIAAAEAGCDVLLTEDFQDGFKWNGVTVASPFSKKPHPAITSLLR